MAPGLSEYWWAVLFNQPLIFQVPHAGCSGPATPGWCLLAMPDVGSPGLVPDCLPLALRDCFLLTGVG